MNIIQTNEVEFEINRELLSKDFRIFRLFFNSENYSELFGKIIKNKNLSSKILATTFEKSGNLCYVLTKENIRTDCLVDRIDCEELDTKNTPNQILLNLILFYCSKYYTNDRNEKIISNVDGNLYSFVEKYKNHFTALHLYFKETNGVITLNSDLTTFTKLTCFKGAIKEKVMKYPKYSITSSHQIIRVFDIDEDIYVRKSTDKDKKNNIQEFAISTAFFKTRVSHLCKIYETMMHSKYINFFEFKTEEYNLINDQYYKEHEKYIEKFSPTITIINKCNDSLYSDWLEYWFKLFGYSTQQSSSYGQYNVVIIPSANKEHNEMHHNYEVVKNCIVKSNIKTNDTKQNRNTMRSIVKTIINQLLIKEDIKDNKIDLFDFKKVNSFFVSTTIYDILYDNKTKRFSYSSLTTNNNGEITEIFLDKPVNILEGKIYTICNKILINKSAKIIRIDNEYFIINDIFKTLPMIDKLYDMIYGEEYIEINRKVDLVKNVFHCYLESGYKISDNKLFYFSNAGTPGLSIKKSIRNANIIREIHNIDNKPLKETTINLLLMTIYTTFVRYNVYSTQPFLFKYLDEIKRMEKEKSSDSIKND